MKAPALHFGSLAIVLVLASHGFAADPPVSDDWAFKPLSKAMPPLGTSHPVDAFLLAKSKQRKLEYAPPADKRTLLRRVTFDLTGLPPTPAEIDAFAKDDSPTAFEKVVDRLLASPRYGERFALFWLDAVRYAESDGFKSDDARPNAWRYRDYAIASFNADKPYDLFVREQIAGDELFPNDPQGLIATGFLRHTPSEYNAVDVELKRQDRLNDIADTTASAFLGLTLGCAKCHDHKTDPITQEDYYRFQAFFAGCQPKDVTVLNEAERAAYQAKLAAWEAKTAEIRKEMAELEKPIREKGFKKELNRFGEEYARLIEIPEEKRTPLEKQLAVMVEKQVYNAAKFTPTQMKAPDREKWEGMAKRMAELSKDKPPEPPSVMGMSDVGPQAPVTHLLKRGNWRKPSDELEPGFLSTIDDREPKIAATAAGTTGRRTALANWIVSKDNPLTARVMVNRVWQHLFERGLVATPADFGATGEKPTHPELLDWLAADFQENGWRVKHLVKRLVTSAAYQQASVAEHGLNSDPKNLLLWRMNRKRLDGETLRDSLLAVSGQLNPKAGGPSIYPDLPKELAEAAKNWKPSSDPSERNRRSVYVAVKRNLRYPLFTLFDSPDRVEACSRRFVTTTAPQALTLLNDQIVLGYAKAFAGRVLKEAGTDGAKAIDRAFLEAFGRKPSTEERAAAEDFLKKHAGSFAVAVEDLCHAMVNLNEFLYVD